MILSCYFSIERKNGIVVLPLGTKMRTCDGKYTFELSASCMRSGTYLSLTQIDMGNHFQDNLIRVSNVEYFGGETKENIDNALKYTIGYDIENVEILSIP